MMAMRGDICEDLGSNCKGNGQHRVGYRLYPGRETQACELGRSSQTPHRCLKPMSQSSRPGETELLGHAGAILRQVGYSRMWNLGSSTYSTLVRFGGPRAVEQQGKSRAFFRRGSINVD